MVNKFLKLINRESSGLHEAAFLLTFLSFLAQFLALLRDHLLAASFGAGKMLDIYYAAFRVPDMVYATIASFVSVTVLIPFLISKIEKKEMSEAKAFLNSVFTVFCGVMVVVCGILYVIMPYLTKFTAPGFDPAARAQLILLSRILLLSPFLLGISNLLGSITQSLRYFLVFSISPLLYNVGIISGIVIFYPLLGLSGLVWGVAVGAFLHLAIQLPVLFANDFVPKLTKAINFPEVKKVILISLPRTVTLAASQIAILFLVSLASLMKAGSISVFTFSYNLESVPLIVGVSYSVAAFPTLTRLFSKGETTKFIGQVSNTIKHVAFWSIFSSVLFIVLRAQIVRVVLGAGRFNWDNTRLTAAALAIFSISIIAQGLILLFIRAYYAGGKTSKPLWVNSISTLIIMGLALWFDQLHQTSLMFRYFIENLFRVSDVQGTAILMLPLAFTVGTVINLIIFWVTFERDFGKFPRDLLRSFFQSFSASVIGGMVSYLSLGFLGQFINLNTFLGIFVQGFLAGLAGLIVFLALLKLLGNEELIDITHALKKKFWKTEALSTEQGEL